MKQLGYAKGYKYNPAFSSPVEQEYLPEELRGIDFFTWTSSDTWESVVMTGAAHETSSKPVTQFVFGMQLLFQI